MENRCVSCGTVIPEGQQVCPQCLNPVRKELELKQNVYYNGLRLVGTNALYKEVQCRIHRKHRINKKWLKKYGYKTVPDDGRLIVCGDCIFATPKTVKKIIKQMKGGAE